MAASTFTSIAPIPERSNATPDLWNSRYSAIDANFAALSTYLVNNAVFNVMDLPYGAKGDGTTDDTTAIQSAINAAAAVSSVSGALVTFPAAQFRVTSTLVVPAHVRLAGAGQLATQLLWHGTSGFCIKLGNTAGALSYGTGVSFLSVIIANTAAHGILCYGVTDCHLRDVYIEGVSGTTATIGVEVDGANISAFFIQFSNVHCNHVWKGFVHTTSGSVQPTQVVGINCAAFCDNTTGSMGIDVQTVGGVGCGDGVTYIGGNMESCKIGINLTGTGTTILGMRFENPQGTSSDVLFASTARNNQIIGGSSCFTITDSASHPSNQVIGVPKDEIANTSQQNKLDSTLLGGDTQFQVPATGGNRFFYTTAANDGRWIMQNGPGSASLGASLILYGSSHTMKPNQVVVGGANGQFRANSGGFDNGNDYLLTDFSTGYTTLFGLTLSNDLRHNGTKVGFFSATPILRPTGTPSAATDLPSVIALANSLRSSLIALGLIG